MTAARISRNLRVLVDAFSQIKTDKEFAMFLRDILSDGEIDEFAGRLLVGQALAEGKSQRVVAKETGISIATVTRANKWLRRGTGGFMLIVNRLKAKKNNSTDTDKH